MQFKNNTKQRNVSIQGLRSFKDTLPKNVKRIINKKGHIYSETLNNWKYLVGDELFKCCYPKTFKSSNKFGVSTLVIMVKRGHEVDIEYSKKDILNKMNAYFGYEVVEKLKFISFDDEQKVSPKLEINEKNVTINRYKDKISDVKNEKIAVSEARKMVIPIIGIVDTNSDPDCVDHIIPGNDDAIRSVSLLTRIISNACLEGASKATGIVSGDGPVIVRKGDETKHISTDENENENSLKSEVLEEKAEVATPKKDETKE